MFIPFNKLFVLVTHQLLLAIASLGNTHNNPIEKNIVTSFTMTDTAKIAIIPYNYTAHFWVFKQGTSVELSKDQLNTIEILLQKAANNYNSEREQHYKNIKYDYPREKYAIELSDYKRQYVAALNKNGETEVWINCFCKTNNVDWKKEIVMVSDGGKCYFDLKVNLSTNSYHDFKVNGEA